MTSRRKPNLRRYQPRGNRAESYQLSTRMNGSRSMRNPCVHCGQALDGREPYWMVSFPYAAHESCIDWSARPCPFDDALKHLKRAERRVADGTYSRGLRWLDRVSRNWPQRAQAEVVRSGFEAIKRMRAQAARSLPKHECGPHGEHRAQ